MGSFTLGLLNRVCYLLYALALGLSIWNGVRIELGQPGERAHFTFELYALKRYFN